MLTFDEFRHKYAWNGQDVPGVTSILKPLIDLSHVPPDRLEKARQEGKAIHSMVEMDCAGTLDVEGLPEWMKPVYGAWSEFREISGFEPLANEMRVYHRQMRYAGTFDLLCVVPRCNGWQGRTALLDLKRSLYGGPVVGLQLAAYEEAAKSQGVTTGVPRIRRGALVLSPAGKFELVPYDDKTDYLTFLALLTVERFRRRHNLNKD